MKKTLLGLLFLGLFFLSCSSDDDTAGDSATQLDDPINDFVWKAMNHWYFWQADVPALADDQDDVIDDYYTYLNGFSGSENLFNSLIFSADDFSWYIEDVQERLNSFNGITETHGIGLPSNLVLVQQGSEDVVIYVAYVVPGGPADLAGIERGDLIYKVNGEVLNTSNGSLINKLFTDINISLGVATFENGSLNPKGSDRNLTAVTLSINPVHYSTVIEEGGKKIGYLVYNRFTSTYHGELNAVFADFKSQGIDELILDLRYNPGGSVLTSAYFASMIEGSEPSGSLFATLTYNAKRNPQNESRYFFRDQAALFDKQTGEFTNNIDIDRLTNLNRVYILTTRRTASASEMIINGIRPSMEVKIVGTTTVGKNEGSFTVVDAPADAQNQIFTNVNNRNSNHTVGLQPIVFQIFNSLGQSDYADGFAPNISIDELNFAADILPFGDTDEVLLRAALDDINTATKRSLEPPTKVEKLNRVKFEKFTDAMYILPGEEQMQK